MINCQNWRDNEWMKNASAINNIEKKEKKSISLISQHAMIIVFLSFFISIERIHLSTSI